jgi:hypothetical protein
MAIQTEVWIKDINENLYPTSSFMNYGIDYSEYVVNHTVHIPNAGVNPGIVLNRSSWPVSVAQRTDADLTFSLNEYSTEAIQLQWSEALEASYDKRASILYNLKSNLTTVLGNQTAYAWSPSATTNGVTRVVRTSGSGSTLALASGATGQRNAITLADITAAKNILDTDNVPDTDRFLLMPSSIYNNQFMLITQVIEAQRFGQANLPSGVVTEILGFNVMQRPTVSVYATGATPTLKAVDANGNVASTNTTDNLAVLCWWKGAVCIAKGETEIFYQERTPLYQGDLFSALVRHGARIVRQDGKGVAAIVQQ